MGRKIIFLLLALFLVSVVSAEMKFTSVAKNTYNLGETIKLPLKIVANTDMVSIFSEELICNGRTIELPIQYPIVLSGGEEQTINPPIPLIGEITGNLSGTCKIKAYLGEEYALTKAFKISSYLTISLTQKKVEFAPGEPISLEGIATKESGEPVNGFATLTIKKEDLSNIIDLSDSVQEGYFLINSTLPEDLAAGLHPVSLLIYERDQLGAMTNTGDLNYNIQIVQVPTSLEIAYETKEVEPGTTLKIKGILHDQTGEKISSKVNIIVFKKGKNDERIIVSNVEKETDDFLEIPIEYNEPPAEWYVNMTTNGIVNEETLIIKEKEAVKSELINSTIFLTNIGNIPYNNILVVKIGNKSLSINTSLDVDESNAYILSAPDGEYQVEIFANGQSQITGGVILTGKEINIRDASKEVLSLMTHPIVWIFIIIIFIGAAFIIFRKVHKKNFFEYFKSRKDKKNDSSEENGSEVKLIKKNPAELSLSIRGDKQKVSVVCVKIKNPEEMNSKDSNAKATLQKIVTLAEINKAYTYENQGSLFFIFSPFKTRTFKNEKVSVDVATKIREVLTHHNRLYKQKIDFGISINYGDIIGKKEESGMKFMSVGTLITNAKKISGLAEKDILLGENFNSRLARDVKTEKLDKNGVVVYSVKEIRDLESGKKMVNDMIKKL